MPNTKRRRRRPIAVAAAATALVCRTACAETVTARALHPRPTPAFLLSVLSEGRSHGRSVSRLPRAGIASPGVSARHGVAPSAPPLRLVELDDLTDVALEQVIMAAVDSYRMAGSERPSFEEAMDWGTPNGAAHADGSANGCTAEGTKNGAVAANRASGGTAVNGAGSSVVAAVNGRPFGGSAYENEEEESSTPSPDSAAFETAAREEARDFAEPMRPYDAVRAIVEDESILEDDPSRRLATLLAAALLAAAEKNAEGG